MKLLFIVHNYPDFYSPHAGIYNVLRARALVKAGCEVQVIAPIGLTPSFADFSGPVRFWNMLRRIFVSGYVHRTTERTEETWPVRRPRWFWLPRRFFWQQEIRMLHLFAGRTIRKTVHEFQPDAILTSWIHPHGTYAKIIKRYFRGPVVCIAEGSDILQFPVKYQYQEGLAEIINTCCDAVIMVSARMARQAERIIHLKHVHIIANGYDPDRFFYTAPPSEGKHVNIIAVGGLIPVKGHDVLLEAMAQLPSRFRLTVIGHGILYDSYLKWIKKHDTENRIRLSGSVPHAKLRTHLDACHLFCMPSRSESFGIAALEALACGRPVIASDVGGLPDLVREGRNGFLVPPEDAAALAAALMRGADFRWNYREIAADARRRYSINQFAAETMNLFEKLKTSGKTG